MKSRAVFDTNLIVAGLSSRRGASHALLRQAFDGRFVLLASPPLWLEYESVLKRGEIGRLHKLTDKDVDDFLDALATVVEPVHFHYLWRPQLSDPKDEMVLETAMNGQADALVTFNIRDFKAAMTRLAPQLLTPSEFLARMESHHE
jgi:putative PIN family toxin of toxin-antitoxin system